MKRGRKQNDDLPPSRSRDIQRAFRARRAQYITGLERRVAELESENAELRRRLNMPPAEAEDDSFALLSSGDGDVSNSDRGMGRGMGGGDGNKPFEDEMQHSGMGMGMGMGYSGQSGHGMGAGMEQYGREQERRRRSDPSTQDDDSSSSGGSAGSSPSGTMGPNYPFMPFPDRHTHNPSVDGEDKNGNGNFYLPPGASPSMSGSVSANFAMYPPNMGGQMPSGVVGSPHQHHQHQQQQQQQQPPQQLQQSEQQQQQQQSVHWQMHFNPPSPRTIFPFSPFLVSPQPISTPSGIYPHVTSPAQHPTSVGSPSTTGGGVGGGPKRRGPMIPNPLNPLGALGSLGSSSNVPVPPSLHSHGVVSSPSSSSRDVQPRQQQQQEQQYTNPRSGSCCKKPGGGSGGCSPSAPVPQNGITTPAVPSISRSSATPSGDEPYKVCIESCCDISPEDPKADKIKDFCQGLMQGLGKRPASEGGCSRSSPADPLPRRCPLPSSGKGNVNPTSSVGRTEVASKDVVEEACCAGVIDCDTPVVDDATMDSLDRGTLLQDQSQQSQWDQQPRPPAFTRGDNFPSIYSHDQFYGQDGGISSMDVPFQTPLSGGVVVGQYIPCKVAWELISQKLPTFISIPTSPSSSKTARLSPADVGRMISLMEDMQLDHVSSSSAGMRYSTGGARRGAGIETGAGEIRAGSAPPPVIKCDISAGGVLVWSAALEEVLKRVASAASAVGEVEGGGDGGEREIQWVGEVNGRGNGRGKGKGKEKGRHATSRSDDHPGDSMMIGMVGNRISLR